MNDKLKLRRRALLATATDPGGDLIWNVGTFTYYDSHVLGTYKIYWEYPVSSSVRVGVKSTMSSQIVYTNNGEITSNGYTLGPGETESSIQVTSIEPLNDTVYKYIAFPISLNEGDNGELGVNLYNYLESKYGDLQDYTEIEVGENEIIYVNNEKVTKYFISPNSFGLVIGESGIYPFFNDGCIGLLEPPF